MPGTNPEKIWEKAWVAVLLTFIGGSVDAIGYIVLYKVFTGHMSGDSIALGVHLGEHQWAEAFHRGFPIPMFVLGVFLGGVLGETLSRHGVRSIFSVAFTLEALLLILFLIFGNPLLRDGKVEREPAWRFYVLIALPTVAIGLQNATLRRVGRTKVRTTYISGLLTNLSEETARFLFWCRDHWAGAGRLGELLQTAHHQQTFQHMALFFILWLGYLTGGVLGTLAQLNWELLSLVAPLCCLVVVITYDLISPLSPETQDAG